MKSRVNLVFLGALLLSLTSGWLRAENAVDKTADGVNEAADKVDAGAHKAKRKVKHHARRAKTKIQNSTDDNEMRKAGRQARDAGNDTLDKVDDTVHGH